LAGREGNAIGRLGLVQPSTHNGTPEEGYRTALLSDSPHAGVRYAGGRASGRDPAAKPACGTPRAGRRAAAVAPSFGACWCASQSGHGVERGTVPASRTACPEAPLTDDQSRLALPATPASACWNEQNNQQQYSVAAGICESRSHIRLKNRQNSACGCRYGVPLRYAGS
jgi:hypothetical protein